MENEERQFEQEMTPEERHLDAMLSDAMDVCVPQGLCDRVISVSQSTLDESCDKLLEQQLDAAFEVTAPQGLSARVYSASINELQHEQPVVVARIGASVVWREGALAACIVLAVFLAIQFGQDSEEHSTAHTTVALNEVLSVEDEELLYEDLDIGEYAYLADTRELAFVDIAIGLNGLRDDIELWNYGLLSE